MPVAIIGAGAVGATLGQAWLKHGQDVIWGLRNPADPKYAALAKERVKAPAEAVKEADIVARLIAQWLSEQLGQQFVVENRTGAATNIAAEAVVRAPGDGYTLLFVTAANAINTALYEKLNTKSLVSISAATSCRSPASSVHPVSWR
jgi:hypothetical protein